MHLFIHLLRIITRFNDVDHYAFFYPYEMGIPFSPAFMAEELQCDSLGSDIGILNICVFFGVILTKPFIKPDKNQDK